MEKTELIIIGAGPGGIQAAISAAELGIDVTLIDNQSSVGGQYYKQTPVEFSIKESDYHHQQANDLFKKLTEANVKILTNALVWGIFSNPKTNLWQITLHGQNCPSRMEAEKIIIATGAYDRSIPFPGWDLPGVITAGAAQVMVKHQGVLPGKRVVISGTGPLQLAAASNLVEAGAHVLAVLDCNQQLLMKGIPHVGALWGQWRRLQEGFQYARNLIKGKTSYRTGWSVIKVEGDQKVESVTIAKVDPQGNPISSTFKKLVVDCVVVGYGLTPNTDFFRLLDAKMVYSSAEGVFLPERNEWFQTSEKGIYAIGDCAGIGGARQAMLEGKIAAIDIARQLNRKSLSEMNSILFKTKQQLGKERRFAKMLGEVFSIPSGLYSLVQPDTIICRCEQISWSEIQTAISMGAQSVTDIKNITRSGMGNCQGRTCGSILSQLMAKENKSNPEDGHYLHIRPPVHPIPIEIINEESLEETR